MISEGIYKAICRSIRITNTSDNVPFVEAKLFIKPNDKYWYGLTLYLHLPLTKGALKKTFNSLLLMGAKMNVNDNEEVEDILEGISGNSFNVEIIKINCDEDEAEGKFKVFAKVVG